MEEEEAAGGAGRGGEGEAAVEEVVNYFSAV